MTCIVGLITDNKTILAADSAASNEFYSMRTNTTKLAGFDVLTNCGTRVTLGIGMSNSFRLINLMQYSFEIPMLPELVEGEFSREDLEEYLVTTFVPNIQSLLMNSGAIEKPDGMPGSMLIAIDRYLFEIQQDFSVINNSKPYDSIGSGEHAAKASLFTSTQLDTDATAEKLIELAIGAASDTVMSVGGNIALLDIPHIKKVRK